MNTVPQVPLSAIEDADRQHASRPHRGNAKVSPPSQSLPLYPNEKQIAVAILGVKRAHEWKAKAVLLEREGLPGIDPLMGGRSWLAVQRFFAARDGLDPATPRC